MSLHIQHSERSKLALERVQRLARNLGISQARAAVLILTYALPIEYEYVGQKLDEPR
jgi:hypothetical protein